MTGAADENIFILHSAINISVILHFASQLHFYPPPASCQTCVAPSEIEIIQCTCMKYKFCSLPAANYNSTQQLLVIVGFLYLYSRSVWKIIMIFIYLFFSFTFSYKIRPYNEQNTEWLVFRGKWPVAWSSSVSWSGWNFIWREIKTSGYTSV